MTKGKWIFTACFFALVLIAGVVICTLRQTPAPEKKPLTVGLVTWIGYAPIYIADSKGYFRDQGVQVDIKVMDGAGQREAAYAAGALDLFPNSPDAFAILAASGQPIGPAVMALDRSVGGDGVVAKSTIRSWGDLRGKSVGYQRGITSHFLFLWLLEKNGLREADVHQENLDAGQAGAAFAAGKLDAAVTWEPWLSKAGTSGGHVLSTSREYPGLLADVLVVRPQLLLDRPKDLTAFARAWYQAIAFMKSNPAEAARILAPRLGVPESEIAGMLSTVEFFSPSESLAYLGGKGTISMPVVFSNAERLYKLSGVIKPSATPSLLADDRVLRAIAGE